MADRPGLLRRLLPPALFGAVAVFVALPLVPDFRHEMGPGTVAVSGSIGRPRTTLIAPPLGTITARTHRSPLAVEIALNRLDFTALERSLEDASTRARLVGDIERDLRGISRRLVIQLVVAGLVIGSLAAALLPRRSARSIAAAAAGGVLAIGAMVVVTAATFDEEALNEPRFTGALTRAPAVIAALDRGSRSFDQLGDRYEALADRVSRLLSVAAAPLPSVHEGTVAILHVSDIHSNPLGVEFAGRLARAFAVDLVIDTGDLTSFGNRLESVVVGVIHKFDVPYFFVPGNHDSTENRRRLGSLQHVELAMGEPQRIAGIDILGWPDPTFTAGGSITTEEGNEIREAAAAEVAEAVTRFRPDILAVHDSRLAAEVVDIPLVLAGHTHERSIQMEGDKLVLTVGSTGATGLGAFLVEAELPYEAQVVYLAGGEPVAVDYISFSGVGDTFDVERQVLVPEIPSGVGRR